MKIHEKNIKYLECNLCKAKITSNLKGTDASHNPSQLRVQAIIDGKKT